MKLVDSATGAVVVRHCLSNMVTASVTQFSFIDSIFVGDLVICNAHLIYTERTSIEVFLNVKAENLEIGTIKYVCEDYFLMVSLDGNGRPTEVLLCKSRMKNSKNYMMTLRLYRQGRTRKKQKKC